jgi:3-phosphoshikimate 1-carboxyvinyltransferase
MGIMELSIRRSEHLHGEVEIPPNKSHSFRALVMAALADGTSHIHNPLVSSDWMRGTEALEMFGASVSPEKGDSWVVKGTAGELHTPDDFIDCGNSGIIFRFFTGLAGACRGYTVLTGDHSIRHIRPVGALLEAMGQLGAFAVSTKGDGHGPVVIRGPLRGGVATLDGADSQPVSSLLIAASLAEAPAELNVTRPGEKPWVDLTLEWLRRCNVEVTNEGYTRYRIRGRQKWEGFEVTIPRDWSAAMYPIVAAAITRDSEVVLPGMDFNDCQGDRLVINVLREMGADIEVSEAGVVAKSSQLTGRVIDCNDFIDQFMLLAVVGCHAEGETVLTNAEICRHKECDRITEMYKALKAMGADVEERPDGLVIRHSVLRGAALDSRADHRMVMTLATAALAAGGETVIHDAECVKKTFPHFVHEMEHLGALMITS